MNCACVIFLFDLIWFWFIVIQDVTTLLPEWEDGNFYLAKYYDKVMQTVTDNKLEKQGNLIHYIIKYFGK